MLLGCKGSGTPASIVNAPKAGMRETTFPAADGQTVFADFYPAKGAAKAAILMFHQAGSNAGEYAGTAPQVAQWGYDCLALDQRSGGNMWGRDNRTAGADTGPKDYEAAYADLAGAVEWAKKKGYKKILAWGSSYSAALCFELASKYPEVDAVLSFSPGEYFKGKTQVSGWAAAVHVPVFFTCTPDELNGEGRRRIFDALGDKKESELVVLPGAVHGSSTLIPERSPAAAQYLKKAHEFLSKAAG